MNLGSQFRNVQWRGNKQIEGLFLKAGRQIASSIISNGEWRDGRYILTAAGAARVRLQVRHSLLTIRPGLVRITQNAMQQTEDLAARTERTG